MANAIDVNHHRHDSYDASRLTRTVAPDIICNVKEPRTLGERLRFAREEAGLDTNELNRLVQLPDGSKLSDGYISSYETGRRTKMQGKYALAICATLHIRPAWLLEGTGPRRFSSGELPATLTAAKRDKPNLEAVLDASRRKRWGASAIAAARALEHDLPPGDWPSVLDRLEQAVATVLKRIETHL